MSASLYPPDETKEQTLEQIQDIIQDLEDLLIKKGVSLAKGQTALAFVLISSLRYIGMSQQSTIDFFTYSVKEFYKSADLEEGNS